MFEQQLADRLGQRECPHIAALIRSSDELPAVLASFYAFGAARNGWLVQGSLPGMAAHDRARLALAGVDVLGLEVAGRLSFIELDLTLAPEQWVDGWSALLEDRLASGFDAVWFARFPVGPGDEDIAAVLPFEQAWMARFQGRPMVTLCPYIVGAARMAADARVAGTHDAILLASLAAAGDQPDRVHP